MKIRNNLSRLLLLHARKEEGGMTKIAMSSFKHLVNFQVYNQEGYKVD